jgi:3-isopropylmalate/(R)-2-methylmalate dehydratase large subunit
VSAVAPTPINQVFIGTCTGGRVDDIAAAVKILKGHHIPPHTRLVVMPASKEVLKESISKGYIQDLMESGATISAPGCGPCLGVHQGLLADDESCVTTSSRNFPGRMGSVKAEIYIASPATAAATAREGKLADPRKYL